MPAATLRPIDVIVPVYRNAALTRDCIDSLRRHWAELDGRSPRLVLVDDSPDDAETSALLDGYAREHDDLLLMRNERNLGFVQSVNRGLEVAQSSGRDVLLVNSDTLTFAGTLSRLLAATGADPQIGFASPRSNNASLCSLPHFFGGLPPTPDEAFQRWQRLSRSMPRWHFVPTTVGFYMFIAHGVLRDHGCLRTDFGRGYEEENDLVMRAGKTGMRAIVVNDSFAYHAGSASFLLTELDLAQHKHANHLRMVADHPEFMPLVRRYEASAHFRAERMLAGLLPDGRGRLRVCFDLTGMGQHHNGTNEHIVAALRALVPRWSDRLAITGLGTEASFKFHGLDQLEGLRREEPGSGGVHGVAVRLSQPFDLHHLNVLDQLAPVNLYAMLDTIAEDCGPLASDGGFIELWDFVAEHANGLIYNSAFSERQFQTRHPAARGRPSLPMLLSTRVQEYTAPSDGIEHATRHLLVLGNHFPHKASEPAARCLAAAFPSLNIVALGAEQREQGNLRVIRPGTLDPEVMRRLFLEASVVVLPSHIEGFGLGLMHALAAGKPVAARRIPATLEILSCFDAVEGVELFDHDPDLAAAVTRALAAGRSRVQGERGPGWSDWADGLGQLCLRAADAPDVFPRLVRRLQHGDLLRQSREWREAGAPSRGTDATEPAPGRAPASLAQGPADLPTLMGLDGSLFVQAAYRALLLREADDQGLAFYTAELEAGGGKLEILESLRKSGEGRARGVELAGLAEALDAKEAASPPLLQRALRRLGLGPAVR
jgi:GT2 family glycosyltransferase